MDFKKDVGMSTADGCQYKVYCDFFTQEYEKLGEKNMQQWAKQVDTQNEVKWRG